jgi:hypothetical protein
MRRAEKELEIIVNHMKKFKTIKFVECSIFVLILLFLFYKAIMM